MYNDNLEELLSVKQRESYRLIDFLISLYFAYKVGAVLH